MKLNRITSIAFTLLLSLGIASEANAQLPSKEKKADRSAGDGTKPVNVDNFVRAESDHMIRVNMKAFNAKIGDLVHVRKPTTPDNQPVIRMNQDTLYSGVVLDLSRPVKITLPEIGGRYMSMHVVNQDHYMLVKSKPGTYALTKDSVGTRFAYVTIRTFYNAGDSDDLAKAHAAQDQIKISGGGEGPFEAPNWDTHQLAAARKALNDLAVLGFDTTYAFGRKEDVRPVDYLVGAAAGWDGMPRTAALYIPNDRKKYSVGENAGMKLDKDGGIAIFIAAEKPEGVPEENWLPIERKDEDIGAIMRIYVPDMEKMKTWSPPDAEMVE